jgi:hypothetical protein
MADLLPSIFPALKSVPSTLNISSSSGVSRKLGCIAVKLSYLIAKGQLIFIF